MRMLSIVTRLNIALILILSAFQSLTASPVPVWAYDSSNYQATTLGRSPDRYCDPAKSLSDNTGTGTSESDAWNMTQCQTQPTAGQIVGVMPGVSVALAGPNVYNVPAFNPTNSGSSGSPITYVCKHAAIGMDYSTITSNANRCEFRHNGTATVAETDGTGGSMLGSSSASWITYRGFFIDMSQAHPRIDSGVLTCRSVTGVKFYDFIIKGETTNIDSNAVLYRPDNCVGTVLSNFIVEDYSNEPSGGSRNQQGLFSDQYGDQDFLIEKFRIVFASTTKVPAGIYLKGTANGGAAWPYGTVRYGTIKNTGACLQFNALDPSNVSEYHHIVCENQRQDSAVYFSAETINVRNLTLHHLTIAKGDSTSLNYQGCMSTKSSSAFGIGSAVNIRDSICDSAAGSNGFEFYTHNGSPNQLDYIGHFKNASTLHWYNGTQYDSLGAWQGATVFEDNSLVVTTSPFVDRTTGNYNLSAAHAWLTASSTGGELGAYEGSVDPGPDTTPDSGASSSILSVSGSLTIRGAWSVR